MDRLELEAAETDDRQPIITAVVDTETREFVPSGADLSDRFVKVFVPRNPDPIRERWSGKTNDPIEAKPPEDIVAAIEKRDAGDIPPAIKALIVYAKRDGEDDATATKRYLGILKGLA